MKMSEGFEVVNIAEEYLAVPTGENAERFNGVVVLNDAAAFLLQNMQNDITVDALTALLTEQYDVDQVRAHKDVEEMLATLRNLGLITE